MVPGLKWALAQSLLLTVVARLFKDQHVRRRKLKQQQNSLTVIAQADHPLLVGPLLIEISATILRMQILQQKFEENVNWVMNIHLVK